MIQKSNRIYKKFSKLIKKYSSLLYFAGCGVVFLLLIINSILIIKANSTVSEIEKRTFDMENMIRSFEIQQVDKEEDAQTDDIQKEKEENDQDSQEDQNSDDRQENEDLNYPVAGSVWEEILSPRFNGCEITENFQAPWTLKSYPKVQTPTAGEFSLIRLGNRIDALDAKENVVVSFYDVSSGEPSFKLDQYLFYGKYDDNCNQEEAELGLYDLSNKTYTTIDSQLEEKESSYMIELAWSENDKYFLVGQLEENGKNYHIEIYNSENNKKIKTAILSEGYFLSTCGSSCYSPDIYKYDEKNDNIQILLYPSDYLLNESDDSLEIYQYTSDGKLVGKVKDISKEEAYKKDNLKCTPIEYERGGTTQFCQYL